MHPTPSCEFTQFTYCDCHYTTLSNLCSNVRPLADILHPAAHPERGTPWHGQNLSPQGNTEASTVSPTGRNDPLGPTSANARHSTPPLQKNPTHRNPHGKTPNVPAKHGANGGPSGGQPAMSNPPHSATTPVA